MSPPQVVPAVCIPNPVTNDFEVLAAFPAVQELPSNSNDVFVAAAGPSGVKAPCAASAAVCVPHPANYLLPDGRAPDVVQEEPSNLQVRVCHAVGRPPKPNPAVNVPQPAPP